MQRRDLGLLVLVSLAVLLSLGFLLGAPRLEVVAPAEGAEVAVGWAEVRLAFSRPVRLSDVAARVTFDPNVPGDWRVEEAGRVVVFAPAQPWAPGARVQVTMRGGVRAAGLLPWPMLGEWVWYFTVAPERLLFLAPADGPADLYAIGPEGGTPTRLTNLGGVWDYSVAPNGRWVWLSVTNAAQGTDVFLWDLATGEAPQRWLTCAAEQCTAPVLSPAGDWVVWLREGQLWAQPWPAGEPQPLSPTVGRVQGPRWAPDGTYLVYYDAGRQGCVVVEVATAPTEVAFVAADGPCAWGAGGRALFAVRFQPLPEVTDAQGGQLTAAHVWRYDLEAGTAVDLSPAPEVEDAAPTPDGRGMWVALGRRWLSPTRWTLGRQIWLMRPDGSDARPLTQAPVWQHQGFVWSDDGRYLAFVRTDQASLATPPEVWVYDLTSGAARQVAVNAYAPAWLP